MVIANELDDALRHGVCLTGTSTCNDEDITGFRRINDALLLDGIAHRSSFPMTVVSSPPQAGHTLLCLQ